MDNAAAAALSSWSLSPSLLCTLLALALIYLRGWWLLNAERPHKYTARKLVSFPSGLITIFIALVSPIDALAGFLLKAHMIQHLLLIMLAHFSNHLLVGWSTLIPVVGRLFWPTMSVNNPQAFSLNWLPSMELIFLDAGLLFSLYVIWRAACRHVNGARSSLAAFLPWALVAIGLYSSGVWIVFQPMQMRGMMMS
jgi:hypothetical protein